MKFSASNLRSSSALPGSAGILPADAAQPRPTKNPNPPHPETRSNFSIQPSALNLSQNAFTLLEVLLATTLVALVLLALNTLVFSMGELWGRSSETRLFDLHVRSVTRYLESELRTAALPPVGTVGESPFAIQEIETDYSVTETVLTFDLPAGSRLFQWPERALPEVACALTVRPGQGLLLLWHSRLETNFEDERPRETVITPLITAIAYEYYNTDTKTWELETSTPRQETDGSYTPPGRLRLTFQLGELKREIALTIPVATAGLPAY